MLLTDIQIKRTKVQDKPFTLNNGMKILLLVDTNVNKDWRLPDTALQVSLMTLISKHRLLMWIKTPFLTLINTLKIWRVIR